jgi:hypothetical protein
MSNKQKSFGNELILGTLFAVIGILGGISGNFLWDLSKKVEVFYFKEILGSFCTIVTLILCYFLIKKGEDLLKTSSN